MGEAIVPDKFSNLTVLGGGGGEGVGYWIVLNIYVSAQSVNNLDDETSLLWSFLRLRVWIGQITVFQQAVLWIPIRLDP